MEKAFWHHLITEKSFCLLQELRQRYEFVLIGGWAVYIYTKVLKSKDIDIIVDFSVLSRLKQQFTVNKNERLKKYEIKIEGIDIDIYVPYWSDLGLPIDVVIKEKVYREGFIVPKKEVLLILKIFAYSRRKFSLKGKKDILDIISLLYSNAIDFIYFNNCLHKYNLEDLKKELQEILTTTKEVPELGLNQKQWRDFKKKIVTNL